MSQSLVMAGCCCGGVEGSFCDLTCPGEGSACPTGYAVRGEYTFSFAFGSQITTWDVSELSIPICRGPDGPLPQSCQWDESNCPGAAHATIRVRSAFGNDPPFLDRTFSGSFPSADTTTVLRCQTFPIPSPPGENVYLGLLVQFPNLNGSGGVVGGHSVFVGIPAASAVGCPPTSQGAFTFLAGTNQSSQFLFQFQESEDDSFDGDIWLD